MRSHELVKQAQALYARVYDRFYAYVDARETALRDGNYGFAEQLLQRMRRLHKVGTRADARLWRRKLQFFTPPPLRVSVIVGCPAGCDCYSCENERETEYRRQLEAEKVKYPARFKGIRPPYGRRKPQWVCIARPMYYGKPNSI